MHYYCHVCESARTETEVKTLLNESLEVRPILADSPAVSDLREYVY